MPLLTLLGGGGAPVGQQSLRFVDTTGNNPLPPGVIVTLEASGTTIGSAMLQAGGIAPIPITNGTYTASFAGTQAPKQPVTFVSPGAGTTTVPVPNYQSPVLSATGYATESAAALVKNWFLNPDGSSTYPSNVGPNMYALLLGLARALEIQDDNLQQVLGAQRLQSSVGAQIDSWAYDFFAGTFYRFTGETDAQFISRIMAIFATPKATVPGMNAILNVFWPWIIKQFGTENFALDTKFGGLDTGGGLDVVVSGGTNQAVTATGQALGVDTFGGLDTGQQFMDAPGPGALPPVPLAFDAQSNPTLAGLVTPNIAPPYFAVYIKYPGYSDTLIHPILSPSQILTQLVNAWKGVGTAVVFVSNK